MWTQAIVIILFVVIAITVLSKLTQGKRTTASEHEYEKTEFMSAAERSFFGILKLSVGTEHEIFSKVRIADVLKPKNKGNNKQAALNKIWAKHFDFLLCDKATLTPLIAIELNDKSHNKKSRQQRDEFVRKICGGAQLTLLEITASRTYNSEELRSQIATALKPLTLAAGQGLPLETATH